MDKRTWKIMMYANPSWHIIGRLWGSDAARRAADEYEEEVGLALVGLIVLAITALAVYGLLKLIGVI